MRREAYWWNLFLLNFAVDSKKVEQDLIATKGSANYNEVMNVYSKNIWETIDRNSDEQLEEMFAHYIPEENGLDLGRMCSCANCVG